MTNLLVNPNEVEWGGELDQLSVPVGTGGVVLRDVTRKGE